MNYHRLGYDRFLNDFYYSYNRYKIDLFLFENCRIINPDERVLDIGGGEKKIRGFFNGRCEFDAFFSFNLDKKAAPSIIGDAFSLPIKSNSFQGVLLMEVLEHVNCPKCLLKEVFRILKPGGFLIITVPFLIKIHADPYDFLRYSSTYLTELLEKENFSIIKNQQIGNYELLIATLMKEYGKNISENNFFRSYIIKKFFIRIILKIIMKRNLDEKKHNDPYPLGYCLLVQKNES